MECKEYAGTEAEAKAEADRMKKTYAGDWATVRPLSECLVNPEASLYLISVYDLKGFIVAETETAGTREEAEEAAGKFCRDQGAKFYYIRELIGGSYENAKVI